MRVTLEALRSFPRQLEAHYRAVPDELKHWAPVSWNGIPSEHFTALEQVCHVRDIEIEGYQVRFRRTLDEANPTLAGIDSESVAVAREYGKSDGARALLDFAGAREKTMALLETLRPDQLDRPAVFEGYGETTLRGLIHFLCSHDQQHLAGLQWLIGKGSSPRAGGR
jgi:hypothetical protein